MIFFQEIEPHVAKVLEQHVGHKLEILQQESNGLLVLCCRDCREDLITLPEKED